MGFYDNFVRLCVEKGVSPSRAVLDMGFSKSIIARWRGGGGMTDATAYKVATYFGITVDELLGTGYHFSEKKETELLALFEKLTPEEQSMLEAMAQALIDRRK